MRKSKAVNTCSASAGRVVLAVKMGRAFTAACRMAVAMWAGRVVRGSITAEYSSRRWATYSVTQSSGPTAQPKTRAPSTLSSDGSSLGIRMRRDLRVFTTRPTRAAALVRKLRAWGSWAAGPSIVTSSRRERRLTSGKRSANSRSGASSARQKNRGPSGSPWRTPVADVAIVDPSGPRSTVGYP